MNVNTVLSLCPSESLAGSPANSLHKVAMDKCSVENPILCPNPSTEKWHFYSTRSESVFALMQFYPTPLHEHLTSQQLLENRLTLLSRVNLSALAPTNGSRPRCVMACIKQPFQGNAPNLWIQVLFVSMTFCHFWNSFGINCFRKTTYPKTLNFHKGNTSLFAKISHTQSCAFHCKPHL